MKKSLLGRNDAAEDGHLPFLPVPFFGKRRVREQAAAMIRRISLAEHGRLVNKISETLQLIRRKVHMNRVKILSQVLRCDCTAGLVRRTRKWKEILIGLKLTLGLGRCRHPEPAATQGQPGQQSHPLRKQRP